MNCKNENSNEILVGRICEIQKDIYHIWYEGQELSGVLRGKFFREEMEFPVVGDYVHFRYNPYGNSTIMEIEPRKSVLKRPDQSGHAIGYVKCMKEQVMVANFDYVFILSSLNDNYNKNRIARYISITLQGGGIPVVVLTKADLCDRVQDYVQELLSLSDKARIHAISSMTGEGLDALSAYLLPGKTIAFLGSSGVGKSTLVNALAGKEIMKTGAIRDKDAKGRHTTTHREMILLPSGVVMIDTPGMRELGMCDVSEGIDDTFSDITELAKKCRFGDCTHKSEPDCAIKKALKEGTLSEERWLLYKSLQKESRKSGKMKQIAKMRKEGQIRRKK